ncbi:Holliday junction resolvase RuvX [Pseudactinotalea sp. Z1748]|uniref:Holliday junction resolvase RuvX n=1 Tax=Pseudactinotalea sp. Z1748 TaxID=3413027 RepID=UPI003C7B1A30
MPETPDHPAPVRTGVRLGVDAGKVRVGLALSDPEGLLATPDRTLVRARDDDGVAAIAQQVAEAGVIEVVVGLPLHMSGQEGAAARDARTYAARVAAAIAPVPVRLVDERLSSVTAHAQLHSAGRRQKQHREVVDQVAAAVILQSALDAMRGGHQVGEVVKVCEDPPVDEEART